MTTAVLQARVSSRRLPHKVLRPILGRPMLERQIERILRSQRIKKLVVATSTDPSDDPLAELCARLGLACHRGSLDNVLDRFYHAARQTGGDVIVRLTGDCPLLDPALADQIIDFFTSGNYDYASNTLEPTFPDGLDVEVCSLAALETAWKEARLPSELEHVMPFIHRRPDRFRLGSFKSTPDLSRMRWTVDEEADLVFVSRIYEALYPAKSDFSREDVYRLLEQRPEWLELNRGFERNEGFAASLKKDEEMQAQGKDDRNV